MNINIKGIVVSAIEKNVAGLSIDDSMMDSALAELGVDSLDVMLVMMDIQEASGVAISDDDVERLITPNQIINFLKR
jgi:acyl carrier protein